MQSWDHTHDVDAAVLRDLLHHPAEADPRGLRLRGARIRGRLDLNHLDCTVPLILYDCLIERGITAQGCRLPMLALQRCWLDHPSAPAFQGDQLRTEGGADFQGSKFSALSSDGAVRLVGAHIGGDLNCSGVAITNSCGPALYAYGLETGLDVVVCSGFSADATDSEAAVQLVGARIGGDLRWADATITNRAGPAVRADRIQAAGDIVLGPGFSVCADSTAGAVRLVGAHIGGELGCFGAVITNPSGPALHADDLHTGAEVHLSQGFSAVGAGLEATVRLVGAHIGGQLNCADATVSNRCGPAMTADQLNVGNGVFLRHGFRADGAEPEGAVRLVDARISGQLNCAGATITNPSGPALFADRLLTEGGVFFHGGFSAESSSSNGNGTVRLVGARIGGQLNCADAAFANTAGSALAADNLRTGSDVYLREGFSADGNDSEGTVRLSGAHIGGQLGCSGATITNSSGTALLADGLQTDRDIVIRHGVSITGNGPEGALRLVGARIGGNLECTDSTVTNESGPALCADDLQIGGRVLLGKGFSAAGHGPSGTVRLFGVRIMGQLDCADAKVTGTYPQHLWNVDGLTYSGVPRGFDRSRWLALLSTATPEYAAQPYQQLAAVYRAAGHDSDVRAILIAQRHAQLDRGALSRRADKVWGRVTWVLLGYGYQPWRALVGLVLVLVTSAVVAIVLGGYGALDRPPSPGVTPVSVEPCSLVQTIGKGLDLGTPFLPTTPATAGGCQVTTNNATGDALTITRWVLQVIAWALAVLFLAGFTGIVRKT